MKLNYTSMLPSKKPVQLWTEYHQNHIKMIPHWRITLLSRTSSFHRNGSFKVFYWKLLVLGGSLFISVRLNHPPPTNDTGKISTASSNWSMIQRQNSLSWRVNCQIAQHTLVYFNSPYSKCLFMFQMHSRDKTNICLTNRQSLMSTLFKYNWKTIPWTMFAYRSH